MQRASGFLVTVMLLLLAGFFSDQHHADGRKTKEEQDKVEKDEWSQGVVCGSQYCAPRTKCMVGSDGESTCPCTHYFCTKHLRLLCGCGNLSCKTYSNECILNNAICESGGTIKYAHWGRCCTKSPE